MRIAIKADGAIFGGKAPEIVMAEMSKGMHEATAFLEKEVKDRTPQGVYGAKGGLMGTIYGEVVHRGTPVMKGIVAHQSPYGDVIEHGRRPGQAWPPEGSLIRWIEVKLGAAESEAEAIEFLIRRKIGQKGFEGAHMFERALDEGWPTVQRIFAKRGFTIARRLAS